MGEWRLHQQGTTPECATARWYQTRARAAHLEQPEHRGRLVQAAQFAAWTIATGDLRSVVDLGAGDGGLLSMLTGVPAWGYDLQPSNVQAAASRGVDVRYGDVLGDEIEWGDLAVCTETLEHLIDPHQFMARVSRHSRALVCSSPWVERPDRHYVHHLWAWDVDGYRTLLESSGWRVVLHTITGPFQVAAAVVVDHG